MLKRLHEAEQEGSVAAKKMPPVPGKGSDIKAFVEEAIKSHLVTIFAFETCPFCKNVRKRIKKCVVLTVENGLNVLIF